jgi:S1-C subfamily serine protease
VQLDEMTVSEVTDEGAAKKGGMHEGDEIVKIDGTKVADRMELFRALRAGGPKKVVTVLRAGKEVNLNLSWEQPAAEKKKQ